MDEEKKDAGGAGSEDVDKKKENGQDGDNGEKTFSESYVKGIRQEAAKYRTRLKEMEERLGKLESIDTDEYESLKKEKIESEQKSMEAKGEWEQMKAKLVETNTNEIKRREDEIAKRDMKISQLESDLNRTIMENAISLEASVAKCLNPELIGMKISSESKIEVTEDGRRIIKLVMPDGSSRLNNKGEPMSLKERIEEMKQDNLYAMLFDGYVQGAGSNTRAGAGGRSRNPWKKDSFNLTEQGRIVRENPTLAKQLASEAGAMLNLDI